MNHLYKIEHKVMVRKNLKEERSPPNDGGVRISTMRNNEKNYIQDYILRSL